MFSNILDKFSPAAAFAVRLFAAAKLDFHQLFAAGDDTALKAHIEKAASPDTAALVEAATKQIQADLAAEKAAHAATTARLTAHSTAISDFGATVKATDEKVGASAADILAGLNARASIKAADQLAKHGLAAPLQLAPAADPTKAKNPADEKKLTGLARVQAAFAAESARNAARAAV